MSKRMPHDWMIARSNHDGSIEGCAQRIDFNAKRFRECGFRVARIRSKVLSSRRAEDTSLPMSSAVRVAELEAELAQSKSNEVRLSTTLVETANNLERAKVERDNWERRAASMLVGANAANASFEQAKAEVTRLREALQATKAFQDEGDNMNAACAVNEALAAKGGAT